jgi:hypothetical protein
MGVRVDFGVDAGARVQTNHRSGYQKTVEPSLYRYQVTRFTSSTYLVMENLPPSTSSDSKFKDIEAKRFKVEGNRLTIIQLAL